MRILGMTVSNAYNFRALLVVYKPAKLLSKLKSAANRLIWSRSAVCIVLAARKKREP